MFDLNGITPVVANSSQNNGIGGYTNKKPTEDGGIITFSDTTTSDSIFYQSSPFVGYPHVQGLYPLKNKEIWTEKVLLYVVVAFRKAAFGRFDYATKFTRIIAKDMEIRLPYTQRGGIDFAYMESHIREMEESRIREMEAYLKVAEFEDCELTEEERSTLRDFKNHKTRPIVINTIFDIKKGKRLTKDNMIPGTINFIGSTSVNNGVTAKVSNSSHIHNGNTITVTYNGSVGEAFYQTDSFWASDDVNVLTFKRLLNERLALFFCTSLRKSGKKYGYTYKWTKELMEKDEIILPVTSSGSIDYKFMETYIRAIEKLTIQRVKDWRAKEIKTTMDIMKDDDTEKSSLQPSFGSKHYEMQEEDVSMMVADNEVV